jgi:DNA repair exonuclease SbcCD ATPase subunit
LKFLFFNSTSKSKVNADIFNSFRDSNEVHVKGELVIDGYTYIIERKLNRKLNKSNEYTVTNKLEFFKIDDNNNIINLNGEQRRETETFITSAIGNEDDFLTTIMTTGQNLENLIESKPTERGHILTKFLGLETIKIKEDIAKQMYSEWSKKLISNNYNISLLKSENENLEKKIKDDEDKIIQTKADLSTNENELKNLSLIIENLYLKRKNIDNNEFLYFNESTTLTNIENLKTNINNLIEKNNQIVLKEPTKYYLDTEHDSIKSKIDELMLKFNLNNQKITFNKNTITNLTDSKVCPTCKRDLENVNYDKEIEELNNQNIKLKSENDNIILEGNKLRALDEDFKVLKKELTDYEKNKLLKAKFEIEITQKNNELLDLIKKLENYQTNKIHLEENKKIDLDIQINKGKELSLNNLIKNNIVNIEKLENNNVHNRSIIAQNNDLIKKITIEQEYINLFKVYLEIFGKNGLSKVILKNMIPLLNQELFELLVDSCYFTLELNINDKNEIEFIMIDNETRVVKNLISGSGYEKTISSLALRAVLTKISILPKPNIMVMDEIFGKIADENLEMVGEFFKKIKKYFEHILLIVHNPLIRNWSDNIIMIKKEENISSINYITVN